MKKSFLFIIPIIICLNSVISAQNKPLDLAIIGEPLKDFTLQTYIGDEFQLSKVKGKNVLLVFPRGYYDKDIWCDICAYEYLDLVDEFYTNKLAEKFNLEILLIFPYDAATIEKWLADIPEVYESLEKGKQPTDTLNNERARSWVNFANKHYPKYFPIEKGQTPHPFKILSDEKHSLSERLGLFRSEWWGTQVEQNTPAVILLDTEGVVQFKYISQHTIDRPTTEYIIKILDTFMPVI